MPLILLVEDEPAVALGLVDVLRVKGYEVTHVPTGEEALAQQQHDLVLLDATLPGMTGFDVLRKLRERGDTTPVIMLTARATEMDRVLGFELGVDDYVTKPFSLLELLGRLGAVLRRTQRVMGTLTFGPTTVDLERFTIEGKAATLPAKAFSVLKALAEKRGQAVTRDALMDEVWGAEEAVTERTLNNLIVKIRQVIEPCPEEPAFLKTVHGVGYKLDL